MSDDKPKPVEDLKEGLGLIFRAAKGAVEGIKTDKLEHVAKDIEHVAKDAAKEVGRAFESLGNEIDKAFGRSGPGATSSPDQPPPEASASGPAGQEGEPPADPNKAQPKYDDGYAPEAAKGPGGSGQGGPRIG
jgi:hypothetical protein